MRHPQVPRCDCQECLTGWSATPSRVRRGPSFLHAQDVGFRSAKNPIIAVITLEATRPTPSSCDEWRPGYPAGTGRSETSEPCFEEEPGSSRG